MAIKPTEACKVLTVFYITLYRQCACCRSWPFFRPSSGRWITKEMLQKLFGPMHKYQTLRFKMFGSKYILKHKKQIKFFCYKFTMVTYNIIVT